MRRIWIVEWASRQALVQVITKSVLNFNRLINIIKTLIYNGQQERMISNAISEGNSFAFDSSCFEKWTESFSNRVLVYSSTEIFSYTLMYKVVVVALSITSLHLYTVFPRQIKIMVNMHQLNNSYLCPDPGVLCVRLWEYFSQSQTESQKMKPVIFIKTGWMTSFCINFISSEPEKCCFLRNSSLGCLVTFTIADKLLSWISTTVLNV